MNEIKLKRREKWEIVIRGLEAGLEIKLPDNYIYAMGDSNKLCYVFQKWTDGKTPWKNPDDYIKDYRISDISFNYFRELCERMTEEDMIGIVFSVTMEDMKKQPG